MCERASLTSNATDLRLSECSVNGKEVSSYLVQNGLMYVPALTYMAGTCDPYPCGPYIIDLFYSRCISHSLSPIGQVTTQGNLSSSVTTSNLIEDCKGRDVHRDGRGKRWRLRLKQMLQVADR